MEVSQSIKQLRERHGMTQEQFGRIAGVSAMAVSQWENGRAVPRMGAIQKLSDFFCIPKSEIIGDDPNANSLRMLAELESRALGEYQTDERELLLLYKCMDEKGKAHVLQTARICASLSGRSDLS